MDCAAAATIAVSCVFAIPGFSPEMNHEGTRVRGNQVRSTVATAVTPTLLDDGIDSCLAGDPDGKVARRRITAMSPCTSELYRPGKVLGTAPSLLYLFYRCAPPFCA